MLNLWVGYFPTVQTAWGQLTGGPLPGQTDRATVAKMLAAQTVPAKGKVVPVDIPATSSKFKHRGELVYLPPAYFASQPTARAADRHDDRRPVQHRRGLDPRRQRGPHHRRLRRPERRQRAGVRLRRLRWRVQQRHRVRERSCAATPPTTSPRMSCRTWSTTSASATTRRTGVSMGWSSGGTCAVNLTVKYPGTVQRVRQHRRRPRAQRRDQGTDHRPAFRRQTPPPTTTGTRPP